MSIYITKKKQHKQSPFKTHEYFKNFTTFAPDFGPVV